MIPCTVLELVQDRNGESVFIYGRIWNKEKEESN